MRGYINTCIHHCFLAKRSILWELGPFTVICFHFAKHFSGTVSYKYLLTTLCFLCFSKLNLLLMIEWVLEAFDVMSLMGPSPWEVSREQFFSGVCWFITIWWKQFHFNKTCQVCLACSPLADSCTPAQAACSPRAGSSQLYHCTSKVLPGGFWKWENPFGDFWNSSKKHFWNLKNLHVKKVHFIKLRAISRLSIR